MGAALNLKKAELESAERGFLSSITRSVGESTKLGAPGSLGTRINMFEMALDFADDNPIERIRALIKWGEASLEFANHAEAVTHLKASLSELEKLEKVLDARPTVQVCYVML